MLADDADGSATHQQRRRNPTIMLLSAWAMVGGIALGASWTTMDAPRSQVGLATWLLAVSVIVEYVFEVQAEELPAPDGGLNDIITTSPVAGFLTASALLLTPAWAGFIAGAIAMVGGLISPISRRRQMRQRCVYAAGNAGWSVVGAIGLSALMRWIAPPSAELGNFFAAAIAGTIAGSVWSAIVHGSMVLSHGAGPSYLRSLYPVRVMPSEPVIACCLIFGYLEGGLGGLAVATAGALAVAVALREAVRRFAEENRRAAERAALLERAATASEAERQRLALLLHDGVLQTVLAARMHLQLIAEQIPMDLAPEGARLSGVANTLEEAAKDIRGIIDVKSEPVLECGDLELLLVGLQDTFGPLFPEGCAISSRVVETPDRASILCLYQVSREALMNAARHANASSVEIRLDTDTDGCLLVISDDGDGMPADATGHGLGLTAMRERVSSLNGALSICTAAGAGTRIEARLPRD